MTEWIGKTLLGIVVFVNSLMGVEPLPEATPSQIKIEHRAPTSTTAAPVTPVTTQAKSAASATQQAPKTVVTSAKPTCAILLNGQSYGTSPTNMPTLKTGEKVTLSWTSVGADSANWTTGSALVPAAVSGSRVFDISVNEPAGIWSQSLFVKNINGLGACNLIAKLVRGVNANYSAGQRTATSDTSAPIPTCLISSDKMTAAPGESFIITWSSTDADYGEMPGENVKTAASGSRAYTNAQYSRSYAITVFGRGGKAACVIVVPVTGTPNTQGKG